MNTHELLALRQTEVEAAAQAFKQAQAQLQLTQVHYRLAHISVQPEPLLGVENNEDLTLREQMIAAAYFVVNGQLPQINPKPKEPQEDKPNEVRADAQDEAGAAQTEEEPEPRTDTHEVEASAETSEEPEGDHPC